MNLRPAKSEDAAKVAQLHALSWTTAYGNVLRPDYLRTHALAERQALWRERFTHPKDNQIVVVAENESGIVGFCCLFADEHAEWGSYLDNLHVHPSYQSQGLGSALLSTIAGFCEQHCPSRGLYLLVNQANLRAQKFYQQHGASNAEPSVWHAPDGSAVPTYRFAWKSVIPLIERAASRSIRL